MGWLPLTSLQIRASHYSHCLFLQLPSNALGHVLQHPDAARDQLQLLILLLHNQLCQRNGNTQLKPILPGSKPSTPAAASFFASLGQFTFKSKAQNQRTRPLALRTHCSKDWIVKLPTPPADPTCEQSAGLETTKRDLLCLAEVQ